MLYLPVDRLMDVREDVLFRIIYIHVMKIGCSHYRTGDHAQLVAIVAEESAPRLGKHVLGAPVHKASSPPLLLIYHLL